MKPKGIFVNISKTGGTSISRMIIDALPAGSVVTEYGPDVRYDRFGHVCEESFLSHMAELPSESLDMVQAFVGHLPLVSRDKLPFPARYVMVLRDPLARLISAHSYSMRGKRLYAEFYNFGLHLSATYCGSDSWENPISKFLLKKDRVGRADLNALKDIVSDFDVVGTTEDMDGVCRRIFSEFEWEIPVRIQRVNETFCIPVASLPEETIRAINNRNTIDRFLYKHVSEHPDDAILGDIDSEPQGAFSSGDYHQHLASDFAFLKYKSRSWHSSAILLNSDIEYIGYDFGTPRPVTEIWLQLAMRQGGILQFAVEASSDRFVNDIRQVCAVEATAAAQEGQVLRIAPAVEARSWRLRRLSPLTDEALSVAGLAFGDQPRPPAKNIDRCMAKIADIRREYNIETYTRALSEA